MKTKPCHCCGGTGKEPDQIALGAEMRKRRKFHMRTLRSVAQGMKISAAYLSDLERGRRAWNNELKERFIESVSE